MFPALLLAIACRHHAGSDLVQAPAPPSDCAAWYEIDAPASDCRGRDEPRPADMVTQPRLGPDRANCMLRCDQSRPRWEVDIQAAGFHGNVVCTIDGGPELRLAIDADGVSDGVRARWLEHPPKGELAVGAGDTFPVRMPGAKAMPPCSERATP